MSEEEKGLAQFNNIVKHLEKIDSNSMINSKSLLEENMKIYYKVENSWLELIWEELTSKNIDKIKNRRIWRAICKLPSMFASEIISIIKAKYSTDLYVASGNFMDAYNSWDEDLNSQ